MNVRLAVGAIIAGCVSATAAPSWGATPGGDRRIPQDQSATTLQEVVVTARYKSESAQNVPISMTALSGSDLRRAGVTNVTDLARLVPNLTMLTGTSDVPLTLETYIRGVGQNEGNPGFSPGVGVYIDGVYFDSTFASGIALMDIDHIDVLRGPQGTLFGKNNAGGAIRLWTVKPSGSDTGYLELTGGNQEQREIRGAADFAVVPQKLFVRVSGAQKHIGDYMNVIDYACANPGTAGTLPATTSDNGCRIGGMGGEDVTQGRLAVRWLPTDSLTVDFSLSRLWDHTDGVPNKTIAINPTAPQLQAFDSLMVPQFGIPLDGRFVTGSPYSTYQGNCDFITRLCANNTASVDDNNETLTVDWHASANLSLKSISAYESYHSQVVTLAGGGPSPINYLDQFIGHQQYSEELDLTGTLPQIGHGFDWTVGGYYLNSHALVSGTVDIPIVTAFNENDHEGDKDKAAFAHADYNFTSKWSAELGYRYTQESRSYEIDHVPFFGPVPGIVTNPASFTFTRSDYRFSLNYHIAPAVLLYAAASTGFKAGGLDPEPVLPSQLIPFQPEKVISYETGLKSEWLDHRLRLNMDVYDAMYSNKQEYLAGSTSAGIPISEIVNINERIKGFEAELAARPFGALQLNASVGYTHDKYTFINPDLLAQDFGGGAHLTYGDVSPYVPKLTANAGIQYALFLPNGGTVTPRLDYSYRSKIYTDLINSSAIALGPLGLWNTSITLIPSSGARWSLVGRVDNLTNHFYYLNTTSALYSSFGVYNGLPARPRTFSITLRYDVD